MSELENENNRVPLWNSWNDFLTLEAERMRNNGIPYNVKKIKEKYDALKAQEPVREKTVSD